ncbi:transcriptional regulator, TetR family [Lentzea albidocapillata subsp. violacea]|uniref:Transcriptional regulator, TetR family n=1 Tax=Lentzea albidocapillata subsp. violacea TaxID=128104 RepID=A0A1G8YCM9_9PSEU|nr:TetR/AcrR family transcriptional regulator [Lentzea albidocapillata]SDK00471.1 transcriptional regulator, TetR family [Lentzea albidocapillata subsp. violacea]
MDGRAARWAGQRETRRTEIVVAALDAIAEHGPQVSTERIAERAGIARPTLYRHFTDADDLYDTVAHRIAELLVSELAPTMTTPRGSAREVITRIVRTYVVWFSENTRLYRYLLSRSMEPLAGEQRPATAVRQRIGELLRELVAEYVALFGGDPRIADPLAFGLVGMTETAAVRWVTTPHASFGRDELITHLAGWIWGSFDVALREIGIRLDPDIPLPELTGRSD